MPVAFSKDALTTSKNLRHAETVTTAYVLEERKAGLSIRCSSEALYRMPYASIVRCSSEYNPTLFIGPSFE